MRLLYVKDVYEGSLSSLVKRDLPSLLILSLPSDSIDLVNHVLSEFFQRMTVGEKNDKYSKILKDQNDLLVR